jgi:ABC-type multidrug transport system fused ATPase/permease subunit
MEDNMQEEIAPAAVSPKPHLTRQLTSLFQHNPFPHKPRNVNVLHKAEQEASGVNTRVAVGLTKTVGTMWTAYSFAVLAIVGLLAILGWLPPLVALLVVWASQTFIQLVMLPILSVGQNVLGRHAELMAEEQFNTTTNTYQGIEEIMQHLSAQDAELLRQSKMLIHLLSAAGITPEQLPDVQINVSASSHEPPSAGI